MRFWLIIINKLRKIKNKSVILHNMNIWGASIAQTSGYDEVASSGYDEVASDIDDDWLT